jgi:hypothetical protein
VWSLAVLTRDEGFGDEVATMESGFKSGDKVFELAYGGTYIAEEMKRALYMLASVALG